MTAELARVAMPPRIAALERDRRGYPVPYFATRNEDGSPNFVLADGSKMVRCIKEERCWICGAPIMRRYFTFVGTALSLITGAVAEPHSHDECAEYATKVCPFLVKPKMKRIPLETFGKTADDVVNPGHMIDDNPGVNVLITSSAYQIVKNNGGYIFYPDVEGVRWYSKGEQVGRAEQSVAIMEARNKLVDLHPDALAEINLRVKKAQRWMT